MAGRDAGHEPTDLHSALNLARAMASRGQQRLSHTADPQPAGAELGDLYGMLVTHAELRTVTRGLFTDGYHARAVEEAFKALNNLVKRRSGLDEQDGAPLMRQAFSLKSPRLRILERLRTDSQNSEQQGYMEIFAGWMAGIRNPRAHEHLLVDRPADALAILGCANHLFHVASNATKTRSRR